MAKYFKIDDEARRQYVTSNDLSGLPLTLDAFLEYYQRVANALKIVSETCSTSLLRSLRRNRR